MGTQVRDSLAPKLLDNITLDDASADDGSAVEVGEPGEVVVEFFATGAVNNADNVAWLQVQSASDSGFSSDVVTHGYVKITNSTANGSAGDGSTNVYLRCRAPHRYMRCLVDSLSGTSPSWAGFTAQVIEPNTEDDFASVAGTFWGANATT